MSPTLYLTSEFQLRDPMSDFAARYAESPLHRIGFDTDAEGIEALVAAYPDRVFRARRIVENGRFKWQGLLLRFADDVFVRVTGNGADWVEIYAPSAERAERLHAALQPALNAKPRSDRPFF